tara:strand:+ start:1378 stop:1659 length:282 start_codon:yes stop_codon:yes gene_type:complete
MVNSTLGKFLSNKYNLYGMIALANFIIGYIITPIVSTEQLMVIFFLLLVNNFCIMTYGMAQGMIAVHKTREGFLDAMNKLIKDEKKNKKSDTK